MQPIFVDGQAVARIAMCALLLSVFFAVGCDPEDEPEPDTPAATALNVNVVELRESRNVFESRTYFGVLKPKRSSNLGFARAGQVSTVLKQVGDLASEGEEIASVDVAELESNLAGVTTALTAAEEKVTRYQSNLNVNVPRQQVEAAKTEVANLTTQKKNLEFEIARGKIVAPYDCFIAERFFHEGDSVPSGRPVFKVVERAAPIVEVDIAENVANRIEKGNIIAVFNEGASIEAVVAAKSPELDSTARTTTLTLEIKETAPASQWRFGSVVEVRFSLPTTRSGFWVPVSALQRDVGGLWSAYVLEDEAGEQIVRRRTVELLQLSDGQALVQGSVVQGDRIVVDGLNRIVPGQSVRPQLVAVDLTGPGEVNSVP